MAFILDGTLLLFVALTKTLYQDVGLGKVYPAVSGVFYKTRPIH